MIGRRYSRAYALIVRRRRAVADSSPLIIYSGNKDLWYRFNLRIKRTPVETSKKSHITVSITKGIADEIDRLIERIGYWPSRSAFAREACIEKIRKEEQRMEVRLTEV